MRQPDAIFHENWFQNVEPPCISLYQTTHRHHPAKQQDPICFRNLVKEIETSLAEKYKSREAKPLLEPFQRLVHDELFWNYRTEGLAILSSPNTFRIVELQRSVPNRAIVADTFHIKPLLRILQSADRFQILCLDRQRARLFEGNRDILDSVDLTEFPATMTDALGTELTEPSHTVASYGARAGIGATPMHHGKGARVDEIDADRDRFFRIVARGIAQHHSIPSGLPLVLAALPEYHAPFRAVANNPLLVSDGIMKNPAALSPDQLRQDAWQCIEPHYLGRLAKLSESFGVARSRQLGSDDLSDVARAAVAGRVASLLVDADQILPGRIHRTDGSILPTSLSDPESDDMLDDLAEIVLRAQGDVVVVPHDRMPTQSGLAATYRF